MTLFEIILKFGYQNAKNFRGVRIYIYNDILYCIYGSFEGDQSHMRNFFGFFSQMMGCKIYFKSTIGEG